MLRTQIRAPRARCFNLARDVGVHAQTAAFTSERVVPPGRLRGLLELGDTVTFDGRHLGIRFRLTARVVEMDAPLRFVDESVRGPFRFLRHVHEFTERESVTEMVDTLEWEAPFGALGALADTMFLRRHMEWFLRTKQCALKAIAERDVASL